MSCLPVKLTPLAKSIYKNSSLPSAPELLDNIVRKNRGSTARGINSGFPGPTYAYQNTTSTLCSSSCLAELRNHPGQLAQLHLVCDLALKKLASYMEEFQLVERTIGISADEHLWCSPKPELWKVFLYAEAVAMVGFQLYHGF